MSEQFYEAIYGSRPYVLVNDKGFYFDEFNKNLRGVIKYLSYEEILSNLDEFVKGKKVIFLFDTQKKELELLNTYLPVYETPIYMNVIVERFRKGVEKYDEQETLKLADSNNRYLWLSLFVFGRLHSKGLNPSLLYSNYRNFWYDVETKKLCASLIKEVYEGEFHHVIFLELMTEKLLGKETKFSSALKEFLDLPEGKEISVEDFNYPALTEYLMIEGLIYKPRKDFICRV